MLMGAIPGMFNLRFSNDYRDFFQKDDPNLLEHEMFNDIYGREDNLLVAIESPDGVFSDESIQVIMDLTNEMWKMPNVTRVDSITNYQYVEGREDTIVISDFIEQIPSSDDEWKSLKIKARQEKTIDRLLLSENNLVTLVNAAILRPDGNYEVPIQSHDAVANYLKILKQRYPRFTFHMSGISEMQWAYMYYSVLDLGKLLPVMTILIIASLYALLRSVKAALLPFFVVFISTLFTLSLAGYSGISLSAQTSLTPEILITVAIAGSVHILVTFEKMRLNGLSVEDSITSSIEKNLVPCFISSLTTAIGFYSIMFQKSPPQKELGFLAGTGILISFVLSITFLPALMSIVTGRSKSNREAMIRYSYFDRLNGGIPEFVTRNRKSILYISLIMTFVIGIGITMISVNNQWYEYFAKSTGFRQATDYLDTQMPAGVDNMEISIETGLPDGIKRHDYLLKLEKLQSYLETQPEITYTSSIVDILKKVNQGIHGNDVSFYKIPENDREISEYLFLYTLSLPMGMDLNNRINIDYSGSRVTLWMRQKTANEFMSIAQKAVAWLDENFPQADVRVGGAAMIMSKLALHVIPDMISSITIALLTIGITLMIIFRSWKLGLISIIPNILPVAIGFAYMGYFEQFIDWGMSVVAAIGLGIVVDDSIHIIARFRRFETSGFSKEEAVRKTFNETGTAVIFTSIVLSIGFSILCMASFKANSDLGFFTALIVISALVFDLFVTPAILLTLRKRARFG